jgi:hypothetical protein
MFGWTLIATQRNREKLYFALNNPLRCWIIGLLKSYKALSSSDLAKILHVNLSRCHYHLENLNDLVAQDKENRYYLSEEGIQAAQLLNRT